MTVIYLVRHGQSLANAKGIWQGAQIDTPLTELGRTQAQNTKKHLEEEGAVFSAVYSSPLLRAGETAGIIAPNQNITFDSRLKEFDTAYGPVCIGKTSLKDTVNFSMIQKIFFQIHGKLPAEKLMTKSKKDCSNFSMN